MSTLSIRRSLAWKKWKNTNRVQILRVSFFKELHEQPSDQALFVLAPELALTLVGTSNQVHWESHKTCSQLDIQIRGKRDLVRKVEDPNIRSEVFIATPLQERDIIPVYSVSIAGDLNLTAFQQEMRQKMWKKDMDIMDIMWKNTTKID